jgi:hypothetical protein
MTTLTQPLPLVPFEIPPYPSPSLLTLVQSRVDLPPEQFRLRLRKIMLAHPTLTLNQVARELKVTRQRVSLMVGRLDRPTCAHPDRPAPRLEQARARMPELVARVQAGEPADKVAADLGISLYQAMKLGFRARVFKPSHGAQARLAGGCSCWRCRRAGGSALSHGPRVDSARRAAVEDWLAWVDPDDETIALTQAEIGRLTGVGQPVVSRIASVSEDS